MPSLLSSGVPIRLNSSIPSKPGPHPAILLLHGAGGNISFWLDRIGPFVARLGIAVYAVHYFDRTNTTRADRSTILDGRHVPLWLETIHDTLVHISSQPEIDPTRIALVGISLGAFLALALPTQPATPAIKAIVEISGGLADPYTLKATSSFPPTLILHGDQDTVVPISYALALDTLLTRIKVTHQVEILPNEGHWFSHAAQLRLLASVAAFLGHHLLRTETRKALA